MSKFEVKIDDAKYQVDAPDEATAWRWANQTHRAPDISSSIRAGGPIYRPSPQEQQERREQNPALSKLMDVGYGASTMARGAQNLMNRIAPNSIPAADTKSSLVSPESNGYQLLGNILDPGAWMIGGMASKAMPYVPVLNRAATATSPAVQGAGAMGLLRNAAGGVPAGASIGLLSGASENQSASDLVKSTGIGATVGAGANVVLPPAIKALGTGVGKVWDTLVGKYGDNVAARILTQALGNDLAAGKKLAATAPENVTASQALSPLNNDMVSAFGKMTERNDTTNLFQRMLGRQAQNREAQVGLLAGGQNQTASRLSQDAAAEALRAETIPQMNTVLNAANTAGTTGTRLQSQADRLAGAAANKVQDVRSLSSAGQTADDIANVIGSPNLNRAAAPQVTIGQPRIPGRYGYGSELAQRAEGAAQQAADSSLLLGDAARFAQYRADSIAKHGLKPIDVSPIERSLIAEINTPGIRMNDVQKKVLQGVVDKLKEAKALGGGIVDARDLHEIRKSGVNQIIEKMLAGVDPAAQNKYAAELLVKVKPLIDKAIDKAAGAPQGSTGPWKAFLDDYASGMRNIERQEMASVALKKLKDSPKKFAGLIGGDDPDAVRKVFGSEYDISKAMGGQFPILKQAADEVTRDRAIKEGAERGGLAFKGILDSNFTKWHLPNWINAKVAISNRALGEVESRVNRRAAAALQDANKSGKSFLQALEFLPAQERIKTIKVLTEVMGDQPIRGGLLGLSIKELQEQGEY